MNPIDPTTLDRQALTLRQRETARLLAELGCALRKAWARVASHSPASPCPCGAAAA